MNCTRCGGAEAVVKRDAAFYCGKCALARDWEEVIALVQEERVVVQSSAASIDFGESGSAGGDGSNGSGPGVEAAASAGIDLPADPFA